MLSFPPRNPPKADKQVRDKRKSGNISTHHPGWSSAAVILAGPVSDSGSRASRFRTLSSDHPANGGRTRRAVAGQARCQILETPSFDGTGATSQNDNKSKKNQCGLSPRDLRSPSRSITSDRISYIPKVKKTKNSAFTSLVQSQRGTSW